MVTATALLKAEHVGVREFKDHMSADSLKKITVITDHGKPISVNLPYEEVLGLMDILDPPTPSHRPAKGGAVRKGGSTPNALIRPPNLADESVGVASADFARLGGSLRRSRAEEINRGHGRKSMELHESRDKKTLRSSKIIEDDHAALVKAHKAMTPQERLMAFYHHSRLITTLATTGKKAQ